MKKFTLVACFVLATLNVATAQQAALPELMLGRWCAYPQAGGGTIGEGSYDGIMNEQEWKKCQEGDG